MSRVRHGPTKETTISKEASQPWGLRIGLEKKPPFHVTIRSIAPGTACAGSELGIGDRIKSVNGTYTLGLTNSKINDLFKCNKVHIEYTSPLDRPTSPLRKEESTPSGSSGSTTSQPNHIPPLPHNTERQSSLSLFKSVSTPAEALGSAGITQPNGFVSIAPSLHHKTHSESHLNVYSTSQVHQRNFNNFTDSNNNRMSQSPRTYACSGFQNAQTPSAPVHRNIQTMIEKQRNNIIDLVSSDDEDNEIDKHRAVATPQSNNTGNSHDRRQIIEIIEDSDDGSSASSINNEDFEMLGTILQNDPPELDQMSPSLVPSPELNSAKRVLKRKRESDNKDIDNGSSSNHMFCGVKVKNEPIGFGCADSEGITEVQAPQDVDNPAQFNDVHTNSTLKVSVDASGDDDDISYVGGNTATMLEMPHARESCPTFPFRPNCISSNLKFCDFCYCYVCEEKASACLYWSRHCEATHKVMSWKQERTLLRSKLLNLLVPPTRRASFISKKLRSIVFDVGLGANYVFKKALDELKPMIKKFVDCATNVVAEETEMTKADFLETIIILLNILKKTQNELREGSYGCMALYQFSTAVFSTKMFTTFFAPPEFAEAMKADMSTITNPIAKEFCHVITLLSTSTPNSRANWVYESRLGNRCDIPDGVGRLRSTLLSSILINSLKQVKATPAALLEFSHRQGDRFTAHCFYWFVTNLEVMAAKSALDRLPNGYIKRELSNAFMQESQFNKAVEISRYCLLLDLLLPRYVSIINAEELIALYSSAMFRPGGEVDSKSTAIIEVFQSGAIDPPYCRENVKALQRAKEAFEGGAGAALSYNVESLFFLHLCFPYFSYHSIVHNGKQAKRILSEIVLKDASPSCKLLFLHFLEAWGILGRSQNVPDGELLQKWITSLCCDISRDILAYKASMLLSLPHQVTQHFGKICTGNNLHEIFFPVTFRTDEAGYMHIICNSPRLRTPNSTDFVPLYLFTNLSDLKQKDTGTLEKLFPMMWKSFMYASLDYIANANRFKMSNLMVFMQLVQSLDADDVLPSALKEISLALVFFEAVFSNDSFSNSSDDYKLTEMLRRVKIGLKNATDSNKTRWLFWQALLSQVLKTSVPDNKYDILNCIILEDWSSLCSKYFVRSGSSILKANKFLALVWSRPDDVDASDKSACLYLWQQLCSFSPQLIDNVVTANEATLLDTLLIHVMEKPDLVKPYLKLPGTYRLIKRVIFDKAGSSEDLQRKWDELRSHGLSYLATIAQNKEIKPSLNDVVLCVVLKSSNFSSLISRVNNPSFYWSLFNQMQKLDELEYLLENSLDILRNELHNNPDWRNQYRQAIQGFGFFQEMERSSSLAVIECMATLVPSVRTMSAFLSQKEKFNAPIVSQVLSNFEQLVDGDTERTQIKISDVFEFYVDLPDESKLENYFLGLYRKSINPLRCEDFILKAFQFIQRSQSSKAGRVISWIVAFCFLFHEELSRDILPSLRNNFFKNFNEPNTTTMERDMSQSKIDTLTADDVFCSNSYEEGPLLLQPKIAYIFLSLIVCPKSSVLNLLPISFLSPAQKEVTLRFLFDAENPKLFISSALKNEAYSLINDRIVGFDNDDSGWEKFLVVFLKELEALSSPISQDFKFVTAMLEALVKMQLLRSHNKNCEVIEDIFSNMIELLGPASRHILSCTRNFRGADIIEAINEGGVSQEMVGVWSRLCRLFALSNWDSSKKFKIFLELNIISAETKKFIEEGHSTQWTDFSSQVDFYKLLPQMVKGELLRILDLSTVEGAADTDSYSDCMKDLINCVSRGSDDVAVMMLPVIAECLNSKKLEIVIKRLDDLSGEASSGSLFVKFVNEVSSKLRDESCLSYMTFFCRVTMSITNLTSIGFQSASTSASKNAVLTTWLKLMLDAVVAYASTNAVEVTSFLVSLPKTGLHYNEFWSDLYSELSKVHLMPHLLLSALTSDPSLMPSVLSHQECVDALTFKLPPRYITDILLQCEHQAILHSFLEQVVFKNEKLVVRMTVLIAHHLLSVTFSKTRRFALEKHLEFLQEAFAKARKSDIWTGVCCEASGIVNRKKALSKVFAHYSRPPIAFE